MCLHVGMGSRRTSLDKDKITKNKTSVIHNVGIPYTAPNMHVPSNGVGNV